MTAFATILRVGGVVFLVGQAAVGCAILGLGADRPPIAPLANGPYLDIPALDAGGARRATVPVADGIRFGHPLPVVGTRWSVAVHASSQSGDPRTGEQSAAYDSDFTVEVLAVDGPAPSRVELQFTRNEHSFLGQPVPTVLAGKAYVVDVRAPHVRDAAGGVASEDETQRVLDVFPDLGTRARIDEVLPDDPMQLGDRRDDLAAAILRVIHPRAWKLRTGTATLARVDGESAVFDVSLDAVSEIGLEMQLKGTAHVRMHDARLTQLDLDGPYVTKKATPSGVIEPPGTFSLRRRVTSEAAPRSGH